MEQKRDEGKRGLTAAQVPARSGPVLVANTVLRLGAAVILVTVLVALASAQQVLFGSPANPSDQARQPAWHAAAWLSA
jgi:hypothetical protein